jgi:hypothetical protein
VSLGPDGAVYVANTGRAGRKCKGKGEDRLCFGATGRIVRVEDDFPRLLCRLNGRYRITSLTSKDVTCKDCDRLYRTITAKRVQNEHERNALG